MEVSSSVGFGQGRWYVDGVRILNTEGPFAGRVTFNETELTSKLIIFPTTYADSGVYEFRDVASDFELPPVTFYVSLPPRPVESELPVMWSLPQIGGHPVISAVQTTAWQCAVEASVSCSLPKTSAHARMCRGAPLLVLSHHWLVFFPISILCHFPIFISVPYTRTLNVSAFTPLNLTCMGAYPDENITWQHNGLLLSGGFVMEQDILTLTDTHPIRSGYYSCHSLVTGDVLSNYSIVFTVGEWAVECNVNKPHAVHWLRGWQ